MFLSMNWIGDFVDLSGLDKKSLIRNFTLSTAEVEDIIVKGEDTYGVIVARIESIENHPNSKKLHLLKVNTGSELVDIVCGAPNVRVGMRVALARAGGAVCGHKISVATVAGFESHGMCCSEAELGISDDNSGIWEVDDDYPLGTDIKSVYGIDDIIFEVDNKSLTNRPDLWSHYGMAREFATLTGRALKAPELHSTEIYKDLPAVEIDVKATDLVWRYSAIKLENITRKASPVNMRIRLYYCGSRAINFLADLTNYVMLEMGQPMHAFDNKKVDKIEVQTFDNGIKFTTLDGIERNIDDKMLMITSGNEPVAIAGVMGGDASKIEDDTTSLLLESATFDGVSVRKTTTRLGLRTDASMRYEKMLDPELCRVASERLIKLLFDCDSEAKVVSSFSDCYVKHYPEITLDFDKRYVDRYTGIEISNEHIVKTLTGLGFGVKQDGDNFSVKVPSWRSTKDVTIKADIIEEITRIYGYDNFEIKTSTSALKPIRKEVLKTDEARAKDILVKSYRMHEVHSYIWSDSQKNRELGIKTPETVKIINAQTPEHQYIRCSMIPTLLAFAKENRSYSDSYGIFEVGHTVNGFHDNGYCREENHLGALLYTKSESEETVFMRARDIVAELASNILHQPVSFRDNDAPADYEHPRNAYVITVGGTDIGTLSAVHPAVNANIDKKASIVFFEITLEKFASIEADGVHYKAPSKFPPIDIDLTFSAELENYSHEKAEELAKAAANGLLSDVTVKDIYESEAGTALTLRFSFLSNERTLTKQELQPTTDAIIASLSGCGLKYN